MKKIYNKGFTLTELLATIAVLAIILVIAVPQIQKLIYSSRLKSFETTARIIARKAEDEAMDSKITKENRSLACKDLVEMSDDYGTCTVRIENNEAIVKLKGSNNGKFRGMYCEGTKRNMNCEANTPLNCTTTDALVDGLQYVNGQYTYTYNSTFDGWTVGLTDKESTDPVTSNLCTAINGRSIFSMSGMFKDSKAESIDFSSFDTSNVTNMNNMFRNSKVKNLDLTKFDTSNVTTMNAMFYMSSAESINLSSFDTSNVKNMRGMFDHSKITILDLSNFNTTNVTNMENMFLGSKVVTLDLTSFDTSSVTSKTQMFYVAKTTTVYARNNDEITRLSTGTSKPDTMNIVLKNS